MHGARNYESTTPQTLYDVTIKTLHLQAFEAVDELTFLAKCDFVTVKEAAYNALMACGK